MAKSKKKNPAAVALGKLGGKASVAVRTQEQRTAAGRRMNAKRWENHEYSTKYNSEYQRLRRERLKREKEEQSESEFTIRKNAV